VRRIYNEKKRCFVTTFDNQLSIDIQVTDNIKFTFAPQISISQEEMGLKTEITQSTDLCISFRTPVNLQYILNVVEKFEQILSVATLSHVQCKRIFVNDESQNREAVKKKIEIIHHFFREEYKPCKEFYNYLFRYDDIKEHLSDVLNKWYTRDEISPIRSHLVDSLNRHGVFSSTEFLIVVQAIEGFYCRFREDNVHLREIVKNLVTEFKDVRCIEMEKEDIQKIVDSRHYYSHLLPPGKKSHVVQGKELFDLDFKLRKILLCCVLNFMGLNNQTIDSFVARSNNHCLG
uniref:HEPN domain-containing protein n=1 Tax=Porphyromonas sp. TaxID=1924944 RepID=UPI001A613261